MATSTVPFLRGEVNSFFPRNARSQCRRIADPPGSAPGAGWGRSNFSKSLCGCRHGRPTRRRAGKRHLYVRWPKTCRASCPGGSVRTGAGGVTGGWITSEVARRHVQELRHENDAILVGVGTIIADDPLLTDRSGRPRRRPLTRLIVDSRLRLPHESRVVKTVQNDVVVLCSFAEENKKRQLQELGIRVEQIPGPHADGRPDMIGVARRLGELEITSLLIEGGAMVNWAALASGIVDKVFLYYSPKILAGTGSVPFAAGMGFRKMSDAAYVKSLSLHRFGEDFAVEGYLKDPYATEVGT